MDQPTIRVLVVDDHPVFRKGIRALMTEVEGIDVVGEASNGHEAVRQALELQPDVILMDLVMSGMDGIEATRQIAARQPGSRILALTSFSGDDKVFPAIKAGAVAYILKDVEPERLVEAIHLAHRGESSLEPAIAKKVLEQFRRPETDQPVSVSLTRREVEVLRMIARGMSNQEIADGLHVSQATVRTHVSNIVQKLHVANRVQAALYAIREGVASLDNEADLHPKPRTGLAPLKAGP